MKKIMFNTKLGLEQAVLEGRKTQTRRIVNESLIDCYDNWLEDVMCISVPAGTTFERIEDFLIKRSKLRVGEIVAVAQSYKDIFSAFSPNPQLNISVKNPTDTAGWNNKMFVKPELMPHQIRITDVRVERLQDISDEDCLKEGVVKDTCKTYFNGYTVKFSLDKYNNILSSEWFRTPREAFAHLINKVSKKGSWESNPYVFVYDFELVK